MKLGVSPNWICEPPGQKHMCVRGIVEKNPGFQLLVYVHCQERRLVGRMDLVRGQPSHLEQAFGVHAGHFAAYRASKGGEDEG